VADERALLGCNALRVFVVVLLLFGQRNLLSARMASANICSALPYTRLAFGDLCLTLIDALDL
jgi:hypothetical protein